MFKDIDIDNLVDIVMKNNSMQNIPLQKYYKLKWFLDALKKDRFTFQKPSNWDDPFEDFMSKLVNHSRYSYANKLNISDGFYAMSTISKKSECYAMWKNFADSNGVLIYTSSKKIVKSMIKYVLDNKDWLKNRNLYPGNTDIANELSGAIKINKVRYLTDEKIVDCFKSAADGPQFDYYNLTFEMLSIKKKEYDYESEYRVFLVPELLKIKEEKFLYIGYLKEAIDKIVLSPMATDLRVKRLSSILIRRYNFKEDNIEKSHLYDIEHFKKKYKL